MPRSRPTPRTSRRAAPFAAAALLSIASVGGVAALGQAAPAPAAGRRVIDESDRVVLAGNVTPRARPELAVGRTDPQLPMERIILQLALRPGTRAGRDALLAAQQDPASPRFHKWLTPAEYGARFGLADADVQTVTGWLAAHGFHVDQVAQGRGWINFSGTAAQVESAFATEMHDYQVGGKLYHANSINPSIPRGLSDLVRGVVTLHSFQRRPHLAATRISAALAAGGTRPRLSEGGSNYLAPADFATIYGLNQLYTAGTNGSGVTIGIVARSDIQLSDVQSFRAGFGLPANDPVFVHNGPDPGISCTNAGGCDEQESDLDTEWAGAVAPQAKVDLVISSSTNATDGVVLSAEYIVDQNLAAIQTASYGLCEAETGAAEMTFYDDLLAQGAAQGIASFASAGDSGASDCDTAGSSSGSGRAVDFPCSSPHNTCVGGTEFQDASDPNAYWGSDNPVTQGSALSYIPEGVWNESGSVAGGSQLWSTGGGVSLYFPKPSWQAAPGVPADGARDVPDVALNAAGHDGYLAISEGNTYVFSGTSCAAPTFAALASLVTQKAAERQGNLDPSLYKLAAAQYGGTGAAVFHDVKTGNNSVPGVAGFTAGAGYDPASGLGSVDAMALVTQLGTAGSGGNGNGNGGGDSSTCDTSSPTTLCLANDRFAVTATYNAGASGSGQAQAVKLTDDTGYLWFFDASNVEMVVKVLDGCALGNHYWVFAGGLTNVNVTLTVTDTQTNAHRTYTNPANTPFSPIQDTAAFATCP